MGTIVVGYVPKPEGHAALARATQEAVLRQARLVVVNSHRVGHEPDGGDEADFQQDLDRIRRELGAAGVDHEVRQLVRGIDPAEDLINVAVEVDAEFIVIGLRRRSRWAS